MIAITYYRLNELRGTLNVKMAPTLFEAILPGCTSFAPAGGFLFGSLMALEITNGKPQVSEARPGAPMSMML